MKETQLGTVTSVKINDNGGIIVSVSITPSNNQEDIQYMTPAPTMWVVPEEGDIVELTELRSGQLVAHSPHNIPGHGAPSTLSPGDIAFRLNTDTVLHFSKQSDGTYDVSIEVDGDMNLLANQIYVGDTANAKAVATKDHTHDVTYDGGGDNSSTQTTTTNGPSDTTQTEIE